MRKKWMIAVFAMAMLCTACGKQTTEQTSTKSVPSAVTEENSTVEEESTTEASETQTAEQTQEGKADAKGEEEQDLLDAFLKGEEKAIVSETFTHDNRMLDQPLQTGEELDLEAIKSKFGSLEMLQGVEPSVEYTVLKNPNRKMYGIRLTYEMQGETFLQMLVLSEKEGKLEIDFSIDSWSRRYSDLNENGVIFDGGSNGAASHESITYVPDENITYKSLCRLEENGYGYRFYDVAGDSMEKVNAIMEEAAEGNDAAQGVLYTQAVVDEKTYFYYLGMDGITQELVDYIDGIAASHEFTFDGKATVDAAVEEYAKKLGVEEIYRNEAKADWQPVGAN